MDDIGEKKTETFLLRLKTPARTYFRDQVSSVKLQTGDGEMEVFARHAPLVGTIGFSRVFIKENGHEHDYLVRQGVVFVDPEERSVSILAYTVEKFADADAKSISEYMEFILEKLKEKKNLNKYQLRFLEGQRLATEKTIEVLQMRKK